MGNMIKMMKDRRHRGNSNNPVPVGQNQLNPQMNDMVQKLMEQYNKQMNLVLTAEQKQQQQQMQQMNTMQQNMQNMQQTQPQSKGNGVNPMDLNYQQQYKDYLKKYHQYYKDWYSKF